MSRYPVKLFLFDLDGTLVSTGGAGLRALSSTFMDLYNIPNVLSEVKPSGKTDPAIFREIFKRFLQHDMTPQDYGRVSSAYLERLENETKKTHMYRHLPGVGFFLDHLKSMPDVKLALGTGNLERGARIKLEPTGFNPYFQVGGFGSDAESRPELLEIARSRSEDMWGEPIAKDLVYVLGDTELDVDAARKAGFKSVAIATGHSTQEQLRKSEPDFFLDDLTQGLNFLTEIRSVPAMAL